jgi:hypothetical protein
MKHTFFLAIALFGYIFYFSCKTVTVKRKMFPALYNADSAYVLYYNEPGNPRFFTLSKQTDTVSFRPLVENVNGIIIDSSKACSTEGKIYFYEGANAVHTVYFSRTENCDALYFFIGAEKYYTRMTDEIKSWLDKLESTAMEPKTVKQ